jgi:hypothetical protein
LALGDGTGTDRGSAGRTETGVRRQFPLTGAAVLSHRSGEAGR